MIQRRPWWQAPHLRTDENDHRERRVSSLELFFDLVFVVVIAQLSHHLSDHISARGVLEFALLFAPAYWVWIGGIVYAERFESGDLSFRAFTFLQMLPVAAMALFVANGFDTDSTPFAWSYVAARALITFLWWRGGRSDARFRPTANRFVLGFVISIALWIVSTFIPLNIAFVLRGLGLLIDFSTPITTIRLQAALPRLSTSRMPERFSLFVIIVLGEAIVGVVGGMADGSRAPVTMLGGVLGMLLVFGLWWVYFDYIARRPFKPSTVWTLTWNYLHLPLVIAITASSPAILKAVSAEEGIPEAVRWLLALAVALALFTMGALEFTLRRDPNEPTRHGLSQSLKFVGAALAVLVGAVGGGLTAPGLIGLLFVPVLMQMVYGAYVWYSQPLENTEMLENVDLAE